MTLQRSIKFHDQDPVTGAPVTYYKVTSYYDESIMTDDLVDGVLYLKFGDEYFRRLYDGDIKASWFGIFGDGSDETSELIAMFNALPNFCTVDFEDKVITLYQDVNGVTSGDALALNEIVRLYNKHDITLKNGSLKCANPQVSPQKVRYPSTISVDYCYNVQFVDFDFFGRGESYGDSDASANLGSEARRYFIQQNGGAAVTVVKSKDVNFTRCKAYLCGSVGTYYLSSSDKITFCDCYANPASLGYAGYCHDAWCGPNYDNLLIFESFYYNCSAYFTPTEGGSNQYCAKCGILGEDGGVNIIVIGGVWRDFYANAADNHLGYAFGATSCTLTVSGASIDKCDAVLFSGNTSNNPSILNASSLVCARIGRTVIEIDGSPFSSSEVNLLSSSVQVVGGRTWPNGAPEQRITSVVANRKNTTPANILIRGCDIIGASILSINTKAVYGGLRVINSTITLTDRIMQSNGWGSSSATIISNRSQGVIINSNINVASTNAVSSLFTWSVPSPENVYVRTQIDLEGSKIYSSSTINRNLLEITAHTLIDKIIPPAQLQGAYYRCTSFYQNGMITLQYLGFVGLANDLTIAKFRVVDNIIPVSLLGNLQKVVSQALTSWLIVGLHSVAINGNSTEINLYIKGTNLPAFSSNGTYKYLELT